MDYYVTTDSTDDHLSEGKPSWYVRPIVGLTDSLPSHPGQLTLAIPP